MNNQASSIKNIFKNTLILLTGNTGANILVLLSLSIFTYSQGAEIFGYYVLFLTYIEIVSKLFSFQTWQSFIKFATEFLHKNEHIKYIMLLKYSFLIDFVTLVFGSTIVYFGSSLVVDFFNIPLEYKTIFSFMALTVLFQSMELSTGIFRVYDKFKIQAKIAVYSAFIKLILFSLVALLYPTLEMFVIMTIFSQFVTMLMKYYFSKNLLMQNNITIEDIVKQKIDFKAFKENKIFSFIVYNNFDISVRMVSRQFDIVILGKLFGAEIVGLYRIAKEVANIVGKLTDPIYQSIYPELARLLAQNNKKEAKRIAIKISTYLGFAGVVFYIGFLLIGEWSLGFAFGEEFKSSFEIVLVYFIALFIAIVSLPVTPILLSNGLAKQSFWNQFWATFVYCIVLYPFIKYYSAIGASIAYIVYYITWVIFSLFTLNKYKILKD